MALRSNPSNRPSNKVRRLLETRKILIPILAALFWAGTGSHSAPSRVPNRSPSVAPMTRTSATARPSQGLSKRQSRLPSRGETPKPDTNTGKTDPDPKTETGDSTDPNDSGREPLDPAEEKRRQASIQAFIDPLIKQLMSEERVPGAVIAIVRRDRVYMLQGYGYGDLTQQARIDAIRTRFPVGQISATITAAAVLHAHDRGLIQLKLPADAYLADPLPRPLGRTITIEDLILRETGLAAVRENGGYKSAAEAPTLQEYIRRTRPPYRRRDTGPSDYETNLLGYILERQSRLSFSAHLEQFFFRTMGMTRSSFEFLRADAIPGGESNSTAGAAQAADWARAYRYQKATGENNSGRFTALQPRYFAPTPALGLSTTGSDMARYLVMLIEGGKFGQARLLGETHAKAMLDTSSDDRFLRPTYHYGLEPLKQFETGKPGLPAAKRALVSYGDLPGYSAALCLAPSREFGIFLATNSHAPELRKKVLRGFLDRFVFN